MLTTVEEVERLTGETVTNETIVMAQSLVEAYIGRTEIEITGPRDEMMVSKAVAYQTAYMTDNPHLTFEQMAVTSMQSPDQSLFFNKEMFSPFIAPWAIMCCSKLSWRGSRSITTGSTTGMRPWEYSWTHDVGVI